ncbi:EndoU domain-containing protein, partial [Bacillus safensis]|uniref:EndoU domain-containing protein n=1 Tax=Bacillus safensis TaxID=561879 RepID=UPI001F4DD878
FGSKGTGAITKTGTTAAKTTVKKGLEQGAKSIDNVSISNLLPYSPKFQMAGGGKLPYNVFDGENIKNKLLSMAKRLDNSEGNGGHLTASNKGYKGTRNVNRNLDDLKNTDAFKKGTTSNALDHIFEGENIKGQAVGFHYEGMPNSKGKIVGNVDPPNEYGVYRANVEVAGTLKKAKTTFFPKDWTPQQVIDEINIAFNNKVVYKNNRYRGTASTGMAIEFVIKNGKIASAYPLY